VVVVQQSGDLGVSQQHDVTTMATVSPIWSAQRLELFTVHRDATMTTMPSRQVQDDAVNERCHRITFLSYGH